MRGLYPLWRAAALAYFRWARRELTARDPHHPDLPWIVLRLHALENDAPAARLRLDRLCAHRCSFCLRYGRDCGDGMSLLPHCTCEPHEAMVGRYDEDCARHASVREWLKNRRTPMNRPDSRFTHEWHVAINQHCSPLMGSGDWPKWMYEAKAMADEVPRMVMLFRREREKSLPATHKQCSMTPAVPVKDNHLSCCLGVKCRECPELLALEKMQRSPEDIDTAKAWTCASHISSKGGDLMNEGYLLTVSDRMYWDNVHASLAQGDV